MLLVWLGWCWLVLLLLCESSEFSLDFVVGNLKGVRVVVVLD